MLAQPAGGVFGLLPMATPRDRIKRTRKGQKLTAWWVSWLAERHSNDRKIGCMNLLYPREDYRMNNAVSACRAVKRPMSKRRLSDCFGMKHLRCLNRFWLSCRRVTESATSWGRVELVASKRSACALKSSTGTAIARSAATTGFDRELLAEVPTTVAATGAACTSGRYRHKASCLRACFCVFDQHASASLLKYSDDIQSSPRRGGKPARNFR